MGPPEFNFIPNSTVCTPELGWDKLVQRATSTLCICHPILTDTEQIEATLLHIQHECGSHRAVEFKFY